MNRHNPGLAALALANAQRGAVGVQVEVPNLQREGLRNTEAGPPLFQHHQPGLGVRRCGDERVDLGRLEVLRKAATFLPG